MSPYVPTTTVPTVEIPEGVWLSREMSDAGAYFIDLLIFTGVLAITYGLLVISLILINALIPTAIDFFRGNYPVIIALSTVGGALAYFFFFPRIRAVTLSTRIPVGETEEGIETVVYMAAQSCGEKFREKRDDDREYTGKIYFNRNLRICVYFSKKEGYGIIKISASGRKNKQSAICIKDKISGGLGLAGELMRIEEALKQQRNETN